MRTIGISSSIRNLIVSSLRKNGGQSVNELAKRADISAMCVRQHLAYLEHAGLVGKEQRRQPIGRPCTYYKLTEDAEELFPKLYARFANGILGDISEHEGQEKVELIFKWRCERLWERFKVGITKEKFIDRVEEMVDMMNELGLSCEYEIQDNKVLLSTFNCHVYEIAKTYPQLCRYDCKLLGGLLGVEFQLTKSFATGGDHCELIAARNDSL